MRRFLLTASTVAALGVPGAASAQVYYSADVYAPPPGAVYVNPGAPVVAQGPMVGRQVYMAPNAYAAPGTVYVQPGSEYEDAPIVVEGRRYYRDCWWDWGRRRCELKPWN